MIVFILLRGMYHTNEANKAICLNSKSTSRSFFLDHYQCICLNHKRLSLTARSVCLYIYTFILIPWWCSCYATSWWWSSWRLLGGSFNLAMWMIQSMMDLLNDLWRKESDLLAASVFALKHDGQNCLVVISCKHIWLVLATKKLIQVPCHILLPTCVAVMWRKARKHYAFSSAICIQYPLLFR